MLIAVALLLLAREWVDTLEAGGSACDVASVVGTVHCPGATGHGPEVHRGLVAIYLISAVEHVSVTHAVLAVFSASSGNIMGPLLAPALGLLAWMWVGTKGGQGAVGPILVGGVL